MSTCLHTLRTQTQRSTLGPIHFLHYLCMANDVRESYWGSDRRAHLLQSHVDMAEARWGDEVVLFVETYHDKGEAPLKRGDTVWRGPASKVAVYYDCYAFGELGCERVGLLNHRERHGRKLVWTIMTPAEEAAHKAELAEAEAKRKAEAAAKAAARKAEDERKAAQAAKVAAAKAAAQAVYDEQIALAQAKADEIMAQAKQSASAIYHADVARAGE
jgi:pyruvate/2-oxoglutarate dehydrogenase complex dihydrolipoamide acyltransferase (E2) component